MFDHITISPNYKSLNKSYDKSKFDIEYCRFMELTDFQNLTGFNDEDINRLKKEDVIKIYRDRGKKFVDIYEYRGLL